MVAAGAAPRSRRRSDIVEGEERGCRNERGEREVAETKEAKERRRKRETKRQREVVALSLYVDEDDEKKKKQRLGGGADKSCVGCLASAATTATRYCGLVVWRPVGAATGSHNRRECLHANTPIPLRGVATSPPRRSTYNYFVRHRQNVGRVGHPELYCQD
jgi:hypothetical protein